MGRMKFIAWWIVSIVVMVFGGVGVVSGLVIHSRIPAESELTYVEGVPQDVETPGGGKVDYVVRFTVDGFRIDHPTQSRSYATVAHRVQTRVPVRVGIASLVGGKPDKSQLATLWTMERGDEKILSYADSLEDEFVVTRAIVLSGGLFFVLGAAATIGCFVLGRRRRREAAAS